MPHYQAISRERHANRCWRPSSNYAFAAREALVPLVAAELPKAMMSLPIAFTEQGGAYLPAAVLSLLPGKDLFVAQSGSWAGDYIPSAFRAYPFRLATTGDGQQLLCIDDDSGLVGDDGERFFSDDGRPTPAIVNVLNFLTQIEQNRVATAAACAALQKHQLIRPWAITLKTDAGEQQIAGLFQIDEAALLRLPGDALAELAQAGSLSIAYCQALSMQHLPLLGQLIDAHAQAAEQALAIAQSAPDGEPDFEFFNRDGTFNFGNL